MILKTRLLLLNTGSTGSNGPPKVCGRKRLLFVFVAFSSHRETRETVIRTSTRKVPGTCTVLVPGTVLVGTGRVPGTGTVLVEGTTVRPSVCLLHECVKSEARDDDDSRFKMLDRLHISIYSYRTVTTTSAVKLKRTNNGTFNCRYL